jgi:hypothetical protein
LNETREYRIENRRWDPWTGAASAAIGTVYDTALAFKGNGKEKVKDGKMREKIETSRDLDPGEGSTRSNSVATNSTAMNFGKAGGSLMKGAVIDIPLAFAEGLRQAPRLYGDKVREQEAITDWKSGGVVAGKVRLPLILPPHPSPGSLSSICCGLSLTDTPSRTLRLASTTASPVWSWIPSAATAPKAPPVSPKASGRA